MGARSSKFRLFHRKSVRSKTASAGKCMVKKRVGSCTSSASTARLLNEPQNEWAATEGGGGGGGHIVQCQNEGERAEEMMLLGLWSGEGRQLMEMDDSNANSSREKVAAQALDELGEMQKEMDTMMNALRSQMDRLENEQRRKLQICTKKWRNFFLFDANGDGGSVKGRKKLDSMLEECRLRNALLSDKFRNCTDYLNGFDALIRSIQREQNRNEDDDFLREFLLKTAKRQHKKGQLSQAVDTFCQLLIATDGKLRGDEMAVLADVCREKVEHTREFHERISRVVRQQMDNSPFVVDELWGSVLEELRAECADAFEIVMRVRSKAEGEEEEDGIRDDTENMNGINGEQQRPSVEQLKYLLGSTICALWLQITPYGHEEFDEVKELFFRTLDQYMKTFRLGNCPIQEQQQRQQTVMDGMELEQTVKQLLGQYPKLAGTKKMRKIAQRLFCGRKDGGGGSAKSRPMINDENSYGGAPMPTKTNTVPHHILVEY